MIPRLIAIGSAALILSSASAARAGDTFKAELLPEHEVPPVTDQPTTGKFEIQFNRDVTSGEFKLVVNKGTQVIQSHLHCGAAGVNGPVIIFLAGAPTAPGAWDVDGQWVSNASVTSADIVNTACGDTLAKIIDKARQGMVYANVHNKAHPGGVARGQLEEQ